METRHAKRVNIELRGRLILPLDTKKKVHLLKNVGFKTKDISSSGALIFVSYYLPKGIDITLQFPKDKKRGMDRFEIPAQISYVKFETVKRYKLGVKFKQLNLEQKEFIKKILEK